ATPATSAPAAMAVSRRMRIPFGSFRSAGDPGEEIGEVVLDIGEAAEPVRAGLGQPAHVAAPQPDDPGRRRLAGVARVRAGGVGAADGDAGAVLLGQERVVRLRVRRRTLVEDVQEHLAIRVDATGRRLARPLTTRSAPSEGG